MEGFILNEGFLNPSKFDKVYKEKYNKFKNSDSEDYPYKELEDLVKSTLPLIEKASQARKLVYVLMLEWETIHHEDSWQSNTNDGRNQKKALDLIKKTVPSLVKKYNLPDPEMDSYVRK